MNELEGGPRVVAYVMAVCLGWTLVLGAAVLVWWWR